MKGKIKISRLTGLTINKIMFCISFFHLLMPAFLFAAEPGQQILGPNELQEIFIEILQPDIPGRIEDIRISDFSSQPEKLLLPAGKINFQPERPQQGPLSPGKKFLSGHILAGNQKCAKVKMYGTMHFFNTVVLTATPLARHTIIEKNDLTTDFREVSFLADNFIDNPALAVGKELKRSIVGNAILYSNFLKNPPLVKRGDKVTITATSGAIKITAPGEVKNTAGMGESVRVKNLMSRRMLQATVVGKGQVQVEL